MKTPSIFTPVDVDRISLIFGGDMAKDQYQDYKATWGKDLFTDLFHKGLNTICFYPKPGIDKDKAFNHISSIMRSFQPKHEHKTAACAYLFELWFNKVEWTAK